MRIEGATAFVTGEQTGLGAALTQALLERGAVKVYVASRHPRDDEDARIVPLLLDVRDPAAVEAAAADADDVSILINNAGAYHGTRLLTADVDDVRDEFETNAVGVLMMTRAFAPVLQSNGGGAVLNVLSLLAWLSAGDAYSASRAAAWSLTNSFRRALQPAGTLVTGLHVGFMDTSLTKAYDVPKTDPRVVAAAALDGIAAGRDEVLADDDSRVAKAMLSGDPAKLVFG